MDEMRRYIAELNAAIHDRRVWFAMSQDTFVAVGRRDGKATVLGATSTENVPTSGGWRMVHHVNGVPVVETFGSAVEAVAAAAAIPAEAILTPAGAV